MKKAMLFIIAILFFPFSVMALSPLDDNDMARVTGQTGITIDISELHISFQLNTISWGDYDGLGTSYYEEVLQRISYLPVPVSAITGVINSGYVNLTMVRYLSGIWLQ